MAFGLLPWALEVPPYLQATLWITKTCCRFFSKQVPSSHLRNGANKTRGLGERLCRKTTPVTEICPFNDCVAMAKSPAISGPSETGRVEAGTPICEPTELLQLRRVLDLLLCLSLSPFPPKYKGNTSLLASVQSGRFMPKTGCPRATSRTAAAETCPLAWACAAPTPTHCLYSSTDGFQLPGAGCGSVSGRTAQGSISKTAPALEIWHTWKMRSALAEVTQRTSLLMCQATHMVGMGA